MATPQGPPGPPTVDSMSLWVVFIGGIGVGMCIVMLAVTAAWVYYKGRDGKGLQQGRRGSLERILHDEEEMHDRGVTVPYSPPPLIPAAAPLMGSLSYNTSSFVNDKKSPTDRNRRLSMSERRMSISCVSFAGNTTQPNVESVQHPSHPSDSASSASNTQSQSPQSTYYPNPNSIEGGSFCVRKTASSPRLSVARRRAATMVNWTKGKMLGAGTFGKVFVGVKEDGTLVAVKVLDLTSITDEARTRSLVREVELLAALTHEHIVDYYGCKVDRSANELQIFMEYVSNGSLGQLVRSVTEPLSITAVLEYTVQILEGVGYLHSNKVVHRDLKGDNILLAHDGTIKISDFGTSKMMGAPGQDNSFCSVQGTPLWSAPEVFNGLFSPESDVWSIGCVLCELLTGRPPWPQFDNVWMAIKVIARCEDYPPEMPRCPQPCDDFLRCCLAVRPEDRKTVEELKQHFWIVGVEESDGYSTDNISTNHTQQLPQLLRQISQMNTPQHKGAQFRKVKGRLSSAAQMQYDSINLGEPQLQLKAASSHSPASSRSGSASSSSSNARLARPLRPGRTPMVAPVREDRSPQTTLVKEAAYEVSKGGVTDLGADASAVTVSNISCSTDTE
eukprot:TRINITY_DN3052_c1_g1_i1.p1 TRINITY_DN3052_c1_g1~~TRINITY_DN3052_c1_g1_i1.p1  ORF type:complete len:616 (+),score=58.89 TRINITY_DN3052_c1_g1_i1:119-1966(+)